MTAFVADPVERGILYKGDMVKAVLDDIKTHTRRLRGLKYINADPDNWHFVGGINGESYYARFERHDYLDGKRFVSEEIGIKCPYGKIGDVLYVRETWRPTIISNTDMTRDKAIEYAADWSFVGISDEQWNDVFDDTRREKWRPSIHQPRWASRIDLVIKDIWVERIQDITEEDALAEGVRQDACFPIGAFIELWDSINGKAYSWKLNPWVFVVVFERVKA